MAVAVKRTTSQHYAAHRVLLPNGKVFELSKEETSVTHAVGRNSEKSNTPSTSITDVSNKNITLDNKNVNNSDNEPQFSIPSDYYELFSNGQKIDLLKT